MKKTTLVRLAFALSLLLVAVLGFAQAANACPHATDVKYYMWTVGFGGSTASFCSIPPEGPGFTSISWDQVGEEFTDCDGNYSTWGDITSCPDNTVTTHPSCPCSG